MERKSIINVPRTLLYLCVVIFFVYVKIISLFFKSFDPFTPFENLFSAIFFGGLLDAFRKANVNQSHASSQQNSPATTNSAIFRKNDNLDVNNLDQEGKLKEAKKKE